MTNYIEQIEELVEAGSKMRGGEYYCDTGDEPHNDAGQIFEYPKSAMFRDANFEFNSDFFCQAANARPAIKALLDENKRFREALEDIANEDYRGNRPASAVKAYKALKGDV